MKLKNLFIFDTVVALLFGLAFVIMPNTITATYGVTLDGIGQYLGQLLGAMLINLGIMSWYIRDMSRSKARNGIVLAHLIGDVIGLVVAVLAQINGVVNALGWLNVAVFGLLTLGFAYFHFGGGED